MSLKMVFLKNTMSLYDDGIGMIQQPRGSDFFEYWESLGFFDNIQVVLPAEFQVLFEIARTLFNDKSSADVRSAIDQITNDENAFIPDREDSIAVNRIERYAPVGDKMEIETFKKITDLKRTLPRELAQDDVVFNAKLFTRTLFVQKFYEAEADHFKPISTLRNEAGREANKFEQMFYILMDTSRSMDVHMRFFYSKCIVTEFLRRKTNSNARLFFRTFDSKVGPLYRIDKKEDYPFLIEKVLFSTTGGVNTNLQKAVFQAVDDINYMKDLAKSEILVVTDGISKIDIDEMKEKLGDIKLHILKVGDEIPEPDFYEMKVALANESIDFDPASINLKIIKEHLQENGNDGTSLTHDYKRIYRILMDHSDKMFKDLERISKNYIQVGDIKTDRLFDVSYENLENIFHWVKKIEHTEIKYMEIMGKEKLYKQAFFLGQYLQMLSEHAQSNIVEIKDFISRIEAIKNKLMNDKELFLFLVKSGKYHEDKKKLKLDKKEARKLMKSMSLDNKNLTIRDMKKAQVTFTFEPGKGGGAKILLLLIIKLIQFIWTVLNWPVKFFKNKGKIENNSDSNIKIKYEENKKR